MLIVRPRRNRKSSAIRALVQETRLHPANLIYPLFVTQGEERQQPIQKMPGVSRYSSDLLLKEIEKAAKLGIQAIALFPVIEPALKDPVGSYAICRESFLLEAIKTIKEEFPSLCLIVDVALDPYTSHGHDGLVNEEGEILNDETVDCLAEMALLLAEAGVDMVAPSDMMDGRVRAIREGLDRSGFSDVSIHAYSAKYASAFYGPFRDALSSTLQFGDKKTYQMNPANSREAILEASLDLQEGADIIMVKPALPYLDVISKLKEKTHVPISAFQVSGEYAMIKAAGQLGFLDEKKALFESLLSIKRAGADMIFTYGAIEAALAIKDGVHD